MSNLNTVISRVYVHCRKKLMDGGQRKFGFPFNLGDLLLHTIHLRRLCEPCVFTHTCKRKKENPRPLRPNSLATDSSATLHPKLDGCWRGPKVTLQTAPDFAPTAFRRLSAYRHSRLWSTGVFCGDWARDFSHGEGNQLNYQNIHSSLIAVRPLLLINRRKSPWNHFCSS